jgi:hypothetical protein
MIIDYTFGPEERLPIDILYPGEHQMVADLMTAAAAKAFNQVMHMRADTAISGAMRWPNSQEAAIQQRVQTRFV